MLAGKVVARIPKISSPRPFDAEVSPFREEAGWIFLLHVDAQARR